MKKNKYSTPLWVLATILAGMLSPMQSAVNGQLGHWLPGHESPGHWSSNQSRFSQHGTNIFGEMLVTGSWSAQRVSNQCG